MRSFGEGQELEGDAAFVDLEANVEGPATEDAGGDPQGPTSVVVDSNYAGGIPLPLFRTMPSGPWHQPEPKLQLCRIFR